MTLLYIVKPTTGVPELCPFFVILTCISILR